MQLVQAWWPVDVLASFENWHSATLPYPMLLAWQLTILAVQVWVIVAMSRNAHQPRQLVGQVLLVVGGLYFTFMLFRLVAGMTFLQHLPWFQVRLPTIFHLVLAAYLLVLADFHLRCRPRGLVRPSGQSATRAVHFRGWRQSRSGPGLRWEHDATPIAESD